MKRNASLLISMTLVFALVLSCGLFAQIKKDAKSGLDRLDGTIQSIDKEKSTIKIRQTGAANIVWDVVYDAKTAFTYRNEASTFEEVKEGRRIICLGTADAKNRLVATRVDVRDK